MSLNLVVGLAFLPLRWVLHPLSLLLLVWCCLPPPPLGGTVLSVSRVGGAAVSLLFFGVSCLSPLPVLLGGVVFFRLLGGGAAVPFFSQI